MKNFAFHVYFTLLTLMLGGPSATGEVPASDPAIDPANYAPFDDSLLGEHPRLLFSGAELTQLQVDKDSPPLLDHYNKLLGYLGVSVVPASSNFQTNATEAQRQGLWRMPTVAMHYALTGSTTSRDRTVAYMQWLHGYADWETGGEINSGMAAANMMVGAAICYDIMHDYLSSADPSFLESFRQKIFYHARAMFHLGHLGGQGGYWQVDPQNNHRQHRDAGLLLCMLAAYDGNADEEWMLRQVYDEAALIAEYLPADGTSHESSSYQVFGGAHLTLALGAADRCFGTNYLDSPFYENAARFRVQSLAPGFTDYFMYGDMGNGGGNYTQYNMLAAARFAQADLQDAIDHHFSVQSDSYAYGWKGLIWRGTSQLGGDYHKLPLVDHFEDLGITFMRDSWDTGGSGGMFICGAPGGIRLNDYRNNVINGGYVNVAHDDPNANTFILFKDGEWVAETDRYSHNKRTSNHNGILVDGIGQRPRGRAEGLTYLQPGTGKQDMTTMAYITWTEDNGDTVVTEGECGIAYRDDLLSRFRRSFIWRANEYVLVLDDIRADTDREIKWLMQSGTVATRDEAKLEFTLEKNAASCEFDIDATEALSVSKVVSTADNRNTSLGFQQLQLTAGATQNLQVASVYDLWDQGNLVVTISDLTATGATVTVTGDGIDDTWDWTFATDAHSASTIALAKPPGISSQPTGGDVGVNESATLNVHRDGLGPVSYQWYRGLVGDMSQPVGSDSPSLNTGPLPQPTWFWVRITNAYGTTDSDAFLVHLTSGYLLWISNSGATDLDETSDPDRDGLANLLEYALGLNAMVNQVSGIRVLNEEGDFKFEFAIPEKPLMDLRYEVQISNLLGNDWATVLTREAGSDWTGSAAFLQGDAQDGLVPISVTMSSGTFVRLKISRI